MDVQADILLGREVEALGGELAEKPFTPAAPARPSGSETRTEERARRDRSQAIGRQVIDDFEPVFRKLAD